MNRSDKLFAYVFKNLDVLARQVSVGDRDAFKLAFRLYNLSSGLFTMELDAMLGDTIREYPQLFLEELKSSNNVHWIRTLGYPLIESGLNFSDVRAEADRYELEMRIKALASVKDSKLVGLRDECIRIIRDYIDKQYHDSINVILDEKEYQILFKQQIINIVNEAEMANQLCQSIIEIEGTSPAGPFGYASSKMIGSGGLLDQMAALRKESVDSDQRLGNPPLAYIEGYRVLRRMGAKASQLYSLATNPSLICPPGTSNAVKRRTFKKAVARHHIEFRQAYDELAKMMPEVVRELERRTSSSS